MQSLCTILCNLELEKTESISEYQFEKKEALEENDSGTDEFDLYNDEESPAMADELQIQ